jgi:replicative DNA helicase
VTDASEQAPVITLNNFEAEESVLGSILIDPEAVFEVSHFLEPNHFYREINNWIFSVFQHLATNKVPIDFVTVANELKKRNQLEEVGGESYLIGLLGVVPTSTNVVAYAKIIEELATRRRILAAASVAASLALDQEMPLEETVSQAEAAIFEVSHNRASHQIKHIRDVAGEHMETIEQINETGVLPTITTGYKDLDRALSAGGMEKGQLIMIPGDTGMGKSSLLLGIMINAARAGHNCAMFTLEMTDHQMFQRQVGADSRIPVGRLKQADLSQAEWAKYYESAGKLSELPFHIDESAFISPMSVLSKSRRIQSRTGLDVVGVDYLALMGADTVFHNETLRLGSISRALKLIAKDLNVVMLVCAQLNSKQIAQRQDRRPQLADLRFSSDPNNDSDVVMFVYRDDYYNPETSERPRIAEVIFGKQREGWTPTVDLYWDAPLMAFRNLQRQEINLNAEPTSAAMSSGRYE